MQVGDRVRYTQKNPNYPFGWPYGKCGEVVEQPYQKVWYVQLDHHPHSRVPTTPDMVEVLS